jgi:hypothetical protein
MKKYVIYVAGPFRSKTPSDQWEQTLNIRRAEAVALQIWRAGHVAICPHLNTANFQGACPDDVWLEGDLEILKRCDGVVLVYGWQDSAGTKKEIECAMSLSLPVHQEVDTLIKYLTAPWETDGEGGWRAVDDNCEEQVRNITWHTATEPMMPAYGDRWLRRKENGDFVGLFEWTKTGWKELPCVGLS